MFFFYCNFFLEMGIFKIVGKKFHTNLVHCQRRNYRYYCYESNRRRTYIQIVIKTGTETNRILMIFSRVVINQRGTNVNDIANVTMHYINTFQIPIYALNNSLKMTRKHYKLVYRYFFIYLFYNIYIHKLYLLKVIRII